MNDRMEIKGWFGLVLGIILICSCATKSDLRREKELQQLKKEIRAARGGRADTEVTLEELKGEMARMTNLIDEQSQYHTKQFELLKSELNNISTRVGRLEQQSLNRVVAPPKARKAPPPKKKEPEKAVIIRFLLQSELEKQRLTPLDDRDITRLFLKDETDAFSLFRNLALEMLESSVLPAAIKRFVQGHPASYDPVADIFIVT